MATKRRTEEDLELIRSELNSLREVVAEEELKSCRLDLIQIDLHRSRFTAVLYQTQFSADYPRRILLNEVKSKTLPPALLKKLVKIADDEAKAHIETPQVLAVYRTLRKLIHGSLLLPCWEELQRVKKMVESKYDMQTLKLNDTQGTVVVNLKEKSFFLQASFQIPKDYPDTSPTVTIKSTNFPSEFQVVIEATTNVIGYRLVEPHISLKGAALEAFQPSVSLEKMIQWLIVDCFEKYSNAKCPACHQLVLHPEATDREKNSNVVRLYCRDIYHYTCLENYLSNPPFPTDGKRCQACNNIIRHEKFQKIADTKLAERRWAYEQARKREVGDAIDFLGEEFSEL